MKRLLCWIVVALSLCIVISCIPAEAGYPGASSSGGYESSGGVSTESQGAAPGNSDIAPSLSGPGSFSSPAPQEEQGMAPGKGNSGNSPESGEQAGEASPAPGTPHGSEGPAKGADTSYEGQEKGSDGGIPPGSPVGKSGETGGSAPYVEGSGTGSVLVNGRGSPSRDGDMKQEDPGQGPDSFQGQESRVQGTEGTPGHSESGQERPSPSPEEGGSFAGQYYGEGHMGIIAASVGGAGVARPGLGNTGGNAPAGEPPQGPTPQRQQQGPPAHAGQYPCGPAQTSPVPVQGQAVNEQKDESSPRPRTRRTKPLFALLEQDIPDLPTHSGWPLFPFSMLLFGGYRRISRKNVLEHDTRHIIYTTITRHPGTDVKNLSESTGINENTLRYHLVKLIETGKVTYLVRPGVVRFFLNQGAYSTCDQVLIHYLRTDTPREIIWLLYQSPGMTRQQISDTISISGPSVTRQMGHLTDDRVVENRSPGRSNHYYLTDEAASAFARLLSGALIENGIRAETAFPERSLT